MLVILSVSEESTIHHVCHSERSLPRYAGWKSRKHEANRFFGRYTPSEWHTNNHLCHFGALAEKSTSHHTRHSEPEGRKNPANPEIKYEQQKRIYILFSSKNGTLYIGVTSDLVKRVWQHKNKFIKGFSKQYNVDKLGYYEVFDDIEKAIEREKSLKKFCRKKKLDLIEKYNPEWIDLYNEIIQ